MLSQENGRRISLLESLAVKGELVIKNPSAYEPKHLQLLVGAQILAGKREITMKYARGKGILIPEETLNDAKGFPPDKLKKFLENMARTMRDSIKVVIKETSASEKLLDFRSNN
jgi:hypothetical protein